MRQEIEAMNSNLLVLKSQADKREDVEASQLKKESDWAEAMKQLSEKVKGLESEKQESQKSYDQKIAEMTEEMNVIRNEVVRKSLNKTVNNSIIDNDDFTILMVENENLKRKIKILESESSKQIANDKFAKKTMEKQEEVLALKQKNELLERKLVG